jgi:hypothetical protein
MSSNDISGCISEVDTFIRGLSNNSIQLAAGSNLTVEVRNFCAGSYPAQMTNLLSP